MNASKGEYVMKTRKRRGKNPHLGHGVAVARVLSDGSVVYDCPCGYAYENRREVETGYAYAERLEDGIRDAGAVMDVNGNAVGEWRLS
jgi:hypothetical protein